MQEEIENRTVTLIISAVKLTARELKAGWINIFPKRRAKPWKRRVPRLKSPPASRR